MTWLFTNMTQIISFSKAGAHTHSIIISTTITKSIIILFIESYIIIRVNTSMILNRGYTSFIDIIDKVSIFLSGVFLFKVISNIFQGSKSCVMEIETFWLYFDIFIMGIYFRNITKNDVTWEIFKYSEIIINYIRIFFLFFFK